MQLSDANEDINETNKGLHELRQVTRIEYEGRQLKKEPQISDFYKPSDEMKKYQMVFIGIVGIGGEYLVKKTDLNINYYLTVEYKMNELIIKAYDYGMFD